MTSQSLRLGYVILYVPDVQTTVEFYESAFGLSRRFIHESGQYAEMETGATALAFADEELTRTTCHEFKPNRLSDAPAGVEVAFITEDVQASFDHAIKAGAKAMVEPIKKPWGQIVSYVRDNNGFLVEICSAIG